MKADEAYAKMAALCSVREYSPAQILDKLRKLISEGGKEQDWSPYDLIARLEREGYLSNSRFASAYVNDKLNFNGWGRQKILAGLLSKGVPHNLAIAALEERYSAGCEEVAAKLVAAKRRELEHKVTDHAEIKMRLLRYMTGRGFSYSEIAHLLTDIKK